jgi:hypothetical protein
VQVPNLELTRKKRITVQQQGKLYRDSGNKDSSFINSFSNNNDISKRTTPRQGELRQTEIPTAGTTIAMQKARKLTTVTARQL